MPGKIEVAEIFGYWCPHCAHFAPMLEKWKSTMPANARLVLVPAMFDPNDPFARRSVVSSDEGAYRAPWRPVGTPAEHEVGNP